MDAFIERSLAPLIREALADTPVVVIQGPRQSGKSTLAQRVCNLPYVTLDDTLALTAAQRSPEAWLKSFGDGAIIDEVQRAPQLFRSVKAVIDADRRPGRFVLTGSANVLLLPKLGDSLAGRMEVFTLYPFSHSELTGQKRSFVDRLLAGELAPGVDRELLTGGFPEPTSRVSASRKRAWYQAYIRSLMDRDVRDLAQIEGLHLLPDLLHTLAEQPYATLNVTDLSRETGIPSTSLTRYLSLLQAVYLIHLVPAYTASQGTKAAKTARVAFTDSGIWRHLSGQESLGGINQMMAMELHKQSAVSEMPYAVKHFRSLRRYSVPVVLELEDGGIIGLSLIDAEVPTPADFEGLEFLAGVAGKQFRCGVILTRGTQCGTFSEWLQYAPVSTLW
jgi:hypothetical protein